MKGLLIFPILILSLLGKSQRDLQVLISGADQPIDIADLKRNVVYHREYSDRHPVIRWLWEIVEEEFDETLRRKLLHFVTSVSQPPLLGFGSLETKIGIFPVPSVDNLPTASTCMNLLKRMACLLRCVCLRCLWASLCSVVFRSLWQCDSVS